MAIFLEFIDFLILLCKLQYNFKTVKKDKFYFFKKRIGKQRAGFSDLANKYVDYNC